MTTQWFAPYIDSTNIEKRDVRTLAVAGTANLIGSPNEDGETHSIVLDLDCPHTYKPSSTPGHGHLIIPAELPWTQYLTLLDALYEAGVITHGYLCHALRRKATFVRTADSVKDPGAPSSDDGPPLTDGPVVIVNGMPF